MLQAGRSLVQASLQATKVWADCAPDKGSRLSFAASLHKLENDCLQCANDHAHTLPSGFIGIASVTTVTNAEGCLHEQFLVQIVDCKMPAIHDKCSIRVSLASLAFMF